MHGIECTITTLSRNKIQRMNKWSVLKEDIRFLSTMEACNKKNVLHEQMKTMKPPRIGEKSTTY